MGTPFLGGATSLLLCGTCRVGSRGHVAAGLGIADCPPQSLPVVVLPPAPSAVWLPALGALSCPTPLGMLGRVPPAGDLPARMAGRAKTRP